MCQKCRNDENSSIETPFQNRLTKIMVQKGVGEFIQYIGLQDESGVVTSINYPDTLNMHSKDHWKVFVIPDDESLIEIKNTDSFENVQFIVCKLP